MEGKDQKGNRLTQGASSKKKKGKLFTRLIIVATSYANNITATEGKLGLRHRKLDDNNHKRGLKERYALDK